VLVREAEDVEAEESDESGVLEDAVV